MSHFLASTPASLHPLITLNLRFHLRTTPAYPECHPSLRPPTRIIIPNYYYTPSHSPGQGNNMIRAAGVVEWQFGRGTVWAAVCLTILEGSGSGRGWVGGMEEGLEALPGNAIVSHACSL
ncbi:hypothetical protein PILCRDRAFT_625176 [Piloderma croceum F 1598]|uniref:Uncharacterized protein n=1 Tax=Piloderma croceum (strain F 1598) TaxID=765440 RepID=A0A0C3EXH4_PILCF|nr:hypothetical protein PILCRDRAFT_625176 [Piloderma croceum F 1598]